MNDPEDSTLEDMRQCIARQKLLTPAEGLVLGVSGGADSVALLHMLLQMEYKPVVAHLNHRTRGEASDADEAFVRALAMELALPFECCACNVEEEAKLAGLSFEAHARQRRYAFFAEVAKKHGLNKIATAHHADDQAETILMRILRGTGPEGLVGIPYSRVWGDFTIVRPLLDSHHAEIIAWLKKKNLPWREDESNLDIKYFRNLVRHELLPLLEEKYNPQARGALLRLAEVQCCENAHWESALDGLITGNEASLNCAVFRAWPQAMQRRAVMRLAQYRDIELSHERILSLCAFVCDAPTGDYCDMGGGWQMYSGAEETLLCVPEKTAQSQDAVSLSAPGTCEALGKTFTTQFLDRRPEDLKSYCNASRQVFDADKLSSPLWVRSRRDADTLVPFGMEGHKKLSDLLVDRKIPAPLRERIPLILSGDEIIWVVGVAPSQNAAVTTETKTFLQIEAFDAPE